MNLVINKAEACSPQKSTSTDAEHVDDLMMARQNSYQQSTPDQSNKNCSWVLDLTKMPLFGGSA